MAMIDTATVIRHPTKVITPIVKPIALPNSLEHVAVDPSKVVKEAKHFDEVLSLI